MIIGVEEIRGTYDSRPGFFRTASRNNYVRYNSQFRKGSIIRSGSLP